MFKLESFVTPLLANYLNKYIKDLKADDLQLSLWKGEAVLNNLDLRLDAIEHDLGLPFTFVSGNIQELRIKVPWTRLTTEPVVISVNTMECVVQLASPTRNESPVGWETLGVPSKAKVGPATPSPSTVPPPPGYMESLSMRVLNNIRIQFTNLILRYMEDDFIATVLVKNADYFTVNSRWEKSFVEVSQPDFCLRRVLNFQDLHISAAAKQSPDTKNSFPLVERTFVLCRLLTKFDGSDCRGTLATVFNVLLDEFHISVMDHQLPIVRRLVDLAIAFQSGMLNSRLKRDVMIDWAARGDTSEGDIFADPIVESPAAPPPSQSSSWASWALSLIPAIPSDDSDGDVSPPTVEEVKKDQPALPRASSFGAYVKTLTISFSMTDAVSTAKGSRLTKRPILRLAIENAMLATKSREARFNCFRAAISTCRLVATNDCPCGESGTANSESSRPVLSFVESEYSLSERSKLLNGSLFGTADDEKESVDAKAPYDALDSYLMGNSEEVLLKSHGVIVADSASVIEIPDDFSGDLTKMSGNDFAQGIVKQNSCFRIITSPPLLLLDSAAYHRYQHFMQWFYKYSYPSYDLPAGLTRSPSPTLSLPLAIPNHIAMKTFQLSILKPTIMLVGPSHPSCQVGLAKRKMKPSTIPTDLPAVTLQSERFDLYQTAPFYPERLLEVAEQSCSVTADTLRRSCTVHWSLKLSSVDATLGVFAPHHPPFRDVRRLISPSSVEYQSHLPVDRARCRRLWGEEPGSTVTSTGIHVIASLPELLLMHFCVSGLLQDVGSFVAHRTFQTLAESVFDQNLRDDHVLRVDLRCGELFMKLPTRGAASVIESRLESLELSLLIGDSSETLLSTVLKDRPMHSKPSGPDHGNALRSGSMRVSAYNICLLRAFELERNATKYAFYLTTTTKLTVYPDFINRFIENLGISAQYQREFSNASLYREMSLPATSTPSEISSVPDPKMIIEIHHEKVSLDILDGLFEHMSLCVHSGVVRLSSEHSNITSYTYDMRAVLLNLGRACREPCIGPVSGSLQFEAFGQGDSLASFVTGDMSLLPLRMGALTLTSLEKVTKEVLETFKLLKNSLADQHVTKRPSKRVAPSLKVVACHDDLRSRHWNFHHSAQKSDTRPDVNQIRFCETDSEQTMTWRYPELRTVSSAAILPMPFQITSTSETDARQEVICSLQYLKRPWNTFVDLRSFTLMESTECVFRFPEVVPEDFDRLPISDVWRVKVTYNIQEHSLKQFPISVLSLAGCMKINSGIIVGVPSSLHFSLNVGAISLGLIHRVPVLSKTPSHNLISGFTYDSSYPSDQEFCRLKLDKISLSTRLTGNEDSSKIAVESNFWLECDFVNYRFLTVQPLVEPCSFSCNFTYVTEDKVFIQAKLDSKTPLVLHCGQNAVHSLSMGYLAWKMAQTGEYPSLPIMNHIIVCNDTCHIVRVRQYTTDECIYIKPKEMYPYSWRSQRAELKLQFSVETYPNLWSEACPFETGDKLCSFPTAEDLELGLVCTIRPLNNIQKQVILSTQFVVANQLPFDIEVQLFTEPDYVSNPVIELAQEPILFLTGSASSTRCVPVEKIKRYRVRRRGGVWSDSVAVTAKSEHMVIRLPMVSGSGIDVWTTLTFPAAPPGSRLLILSSVICCKNHLPYAVQVELDYEPVRVVENIPAHSTVHFSMRSYAKEDCVVHISRIGCTREPQLLSVNFHKILTAMPPRAFVGNCSDLVGDSDLSMKVKNRRPSEPASASLLTQEYIVEFERQTPNTDTLVLHVKPNGTRIVSNYNRELMLYGEDEELVTAISANGASVLPISCKGQVRLGVQNDETVYLSDSFDVRPSQKAREKMLDCTGMGVLLCGGFFVVTFWEKTDSQFLIHHLTLRLTEEDSVYTLYITSRFSGIYASTDPEKIILAVFVTPKLHQKMDYQAALTPSTQHILSQSSRSTPLSPFTYLVPPNHPVDLDQNRASDLLTYMCVSAAAASHDPQWSFPRQIGDIKNKKSRIAKLNPPYPGNPSLADRSWGLCCKVTTVDDQGVCQLLVETADAPNLVFHNNCPYPLAFGECVRKGPGFVTFEEKEAFIPLPVVQAGGTASYSYPSRDEEFPRVSSTASNYLIRIGRLIQTGLTQQMVVWSSSSVDAYTATNDRFVSIPGICYLKLHFERTNRRTVHVVIDPLSRVATPLQTPPIQPRDSFFPLLEPVSGSTSRTSSSASLSLVNLTAGDAPAVALNVGISCVLKSVIVTLDDEISNMDVVAEVLRLSVDEISFQFYCDGQSSRTYECALNVNDLQLDNQLYSCGFFDFPVVLTKEKPTKNVQSALNILCKLNSETLAPENIHVSMAPMACFAEDTLAFHLLRLTDSFLVPALLVVHTPLKPGLPSSDLELAQNLLKRGTPVVIERLHIAPVEVFLSVHAALKMFVGLNQTPLSFAETECNDVNSTTSDVMNFISAHYMRGTLLQAGWVIGSMDLLGNPASLLRSLTAGCGDLFVRPFSSLHAGPVSFLQGLAKGASSCLAGISAGTITSVTNLAESVSRNLDWASLDSDHVKRRMEVKYRQLPDGLGSGLKQGLTGFGMSVLAGIAGLVDQPMQAVLQPSLTPSQYVTAFMLGVTKGLVGAMSKPIAGAAGLVSQTGQGILRGHGMLNFPPRRYVAPSKSSSGFSESTLKYIWKVAPLLPNTVRTLCVVEATPVVKNPENTSTEPVCLFLTNTALFVISSADDEFRQAYSLSKLNIRLSNPDSNVHPSHCDLLQVTLLIEPDSRMDLDSNDNDTVWPWNGSPSEVSTVISAVSSRDSISHAHVSKESFLLEWKEAKLFQELFLVAKSDI